MDELWSAVSGGSHAAARRMGAPPASVEMKRLPSSSASSLHPVVLHPVACVPAWKATAFESGVNDGYASPGAALKAGSALDVILCSVGLKLGRDSVKLR